MKFVPRFLADGRAIALDGYIQRVNGDVIRRKLPSPSVSAALGDSSASSHGPFKFAHDPTGEPVVSYGSSSMNAWHDQEEGGDGRKGVTHTVHARSSLEGLSVSNRLFVERASAYLKTVYRPDDAQPTITPVEAALDGLVIDGVRFTVAIDTEPVTTCGTCSAFQRACTHDERFKKAHERRVLSLRAPSASGPSGKGCFVCSVVSRITWDGALPPGAEVDEDSHVIVWPDFGKVVLGEMLISDFTRRLTMVRLELGSPVEGSLAAADIQSGGQGLP